MKIQDSVAFVTGANRGFGRALAKALVEGGARKVYAAARDAGSVNLAGVVPIQLDVTDPDSIVVLAREVGDVSLLINNAGIDRHSMILAEESVSALYQELETNVVGPLRLSRAFAPILERNGGGAVVNVLSGLSWVSIPASATYGVSKAAAWSLTNALRNELRAQGTQVVGLHVGYMATDMTIHVEGLKADPDEIARVTLAGLEAGQEEVLADDVVRHVKRGLSAERGIYLTNPLAD